MVVIDADIQCDVGRTFYTTAEGNKLYGKHSFKNILYTYCSYYSTKYNTYIQTRQLEKGYDGKYFIVRDIEQVNGLVRRVFKENLPAENPVNVGTQT